MARILDRLQAINANKPDKVYRWSQKVCDQIESTVGNLQDQVTAITQALNAANARMPDVADVSFAADYTGTVSPSSQLPKTVGFTRMDGVTDVSASSTWSVAASAGITCTIDSAGTVTVTAMTAGTQKGTITATSGYNSISLSRTVNVTKTNASAPISGTSGGGSSGSGGTTDSTSTFFDINSTVAASITVELSVTVGSSGQVSLSAPLGVTTAFALPDGTFDVKGQWYRTTSGTVALGAEVSSDPDTTVSGSGGRLDVADGSLNVSHTDTGLTVGSTQKYRLYARNASGTRDMAFYGTATAVGS